MRTRLIGCVLLGVDVADQDGVRDAAEPRRAEVERRTCVKSSAQRGVERDGQERRDDHRQRLGVGERLEQAPFLRLEREDGQERDRDDEQREEAGRRRPP